MEIVFGIVLALSLIGNLGQYNHGQNLKEERDQAVQIANANYEKLQEAESANLDFERVTATLEQTNSECSKELVYAERQQNIYRAANEFSKAAIGDLEEALARSAVERGAAECRVPGWVEIPSPDID